MVNLRNVLSLVVVVDCCRNRVGWLFRIDANPANERNQGSDDWKQGLNEDAVTAFSALVDADRTAALAQKVCPVTDKPLGSMGKPPKVTVEGQDVFLCCGGCEEELKERSEQVSGETQTKLIRERDGRSEHA